VSVAAGTIDRRAPAEASRAGERRRRFTLALAGFLGLLLVLAVAEIMIDGSAGRSALIPKAPSISKWLGAIGEPLGYRVFLIALLTFTGAYAALAVMARQLPSRFVIALIAALHLIVFIGPILLSTDVFSYIAYARMGVVHGINPYIHGPIAIKYDPVFPYQGQSWLKTATAYGPLYTLLSYPLAPLGVVGALWGFKLEALLASAATLVLTWRVAARRGLNPTPALLLVGANPLYIIYGLAGAHNDVIMTAFLMGAVALALSGRDSWSGASVIAGTLVKATSAAMLPFMIVGRRRVGTITGALAALLAGALVGYVAFGIHGLDIVAALNRDAAFVSSDSFPTELAHLIGKPGVYPVDHTFLKAALAVVLVYLLWRTWRGYDWIAASGWALLAIAVTASWLLAWYTLWALPLAVVVRDRRLLIATLAVQGLFIIHQAAPLIAPVQ